MTEAKARIKDRAKAIASGQGERETEVTLSTGVRVRLQAVSALLIEDLKAALLEPKVPVVYIEDKGREEENPNDPAYLAALNKYNADRGAAVLDATVLFGVELLDGLPEDESWLKKLKALERLGKLDLSRYDLADEFDREFLYKRYVAVAGADLAILTTLSSIRPEEVARARRSFLGNAAGD